MKLYVAGSDVMWARQVATELKGQGFAITSTWHDHSIMPTKFYPEHERTRIAQMDAEQIGRADALVLLETVSGYCPGGKFVEAGIALGQGKKVLVLGQRENMLLWHPSVAHFPTVPELTCVLWGMVRARL